MSANFRRVRFGVLLVTILTFGCAGDDNSQTIDSASLIDEPAAQVTDSGPSDDPEDSVLDPEPGEEIEFDESAQKPSNAGNVADSTSIPPKPPVTVVDTTNTMTASSSNALQKLLSSEMLEYSTGVINTSCGEFAVVGNGKSPRILVWERESWIPEPLVGDFFNFTTANIAGVNLQDLTADGIEELVIKVNAVPRNFGAVFKLDTSDCSWMTVPLIDSCGQAFVYDSLSVQSGELLGSGFSSGCSGRDGIRFDWSEPVQRFIGRSSTRERVCDDFNYGAIILPLTTCDEGWAVQMAQNFIFNTGIQLDVDGYYGPGTHRAVLQFQLRNNLSPTGLIDLETWGHMFPEDWDSGLPDYDGDGISTPSEIMHN